MRGVCIDDLLQFPFVMFKKRGISVSGFDCSPNSVLPFLLIVDSDVANEFAIVFSVQRDSENFNTLTGIDQAPVPVTLFDKVFMLLQTNGIELLQDGKVFQRGKKMQINE